jgi:Zn-dependent peptidase ImmA (M78 family)
MGFIYTNGFMASNITFVGKKDELKLIHTSFNELKKLLGISKSYLYTKALLWIVKDRKVRAEFIKYIQEEKEKIVKDIIE